MQIGFIGLGKMGANMVRRLGLDGHSIVAHNRTVEKATELADEEAAVWRPEDGGRRSVSWRELSREVARLADGLASLGVGQGDAVGIYLPMAPEAAIASHAVAHLGAVQVPIFSGFAAPAVAARLADARGVAHEDRGVPEREGREDGDRDQGLAAAAQHRVGRERELGRVEVAAPCHPVEHLLGLQR